MKHYKVNADRETGEWIGEPEYVGEVSEQEWFAKQDTDEAHYDTYEYETLDETKPPITTETRGIEIIWVDCPRIIKTINSQGMKEIENFLAENHKRGWDVTPDMIRAAARDAEFQMGEGNGPCIEIEAHRCVDGRTVEYTISDSGIDTEEVEY